MMSMCVSDELIHACLHPPRTPVSLAGSLSSKNLHQSNLAPGAKFVLLSGNGSDV